MKKEYTIIFTDGQGERVIDHLNKRIDNVATITNVVKMFSDVEVQCFKSLLLRELKELLLIIDDHEEFYTSQVKNYPFTLPLPDVTRLVEKLEGNFDDYLSLISSDVSNWNVSEV